MKETAMVNCVSVVAGAFAIAVACKVTKSALPLLGFLVVPTFKISINAERDAKNK